MPGGARSSAASRPRPSSAEIGERFEELVELATSNTLVMDRFTGTAVLDRPGRGRHRHVGVVARASGLAFDARIAHPFTDLGERIPPRACSPAGTSWPGSPSGSTRYAHRSPSSPTLAGQATALSATAPPGTAPRRLRARHRRGLAGGIVHRVEVDRSGTLTRCKIVDPSFLNWPALPVALADTIVPDFPLANKSFNLSYAGNDL